MPADRPTLRVFFDTSSVIAGAASRSGASYVLLQLADLGLIDGRINDQVREEAIRNVGRKLPAALPALSVLLREVLSEGASVSEHLLTSVSSQADAKDQPILASAIAQDCTYLITLNERDFWPPSERMRIVRPGELLLSLREVITAVDIQDLPNSDSETDVDSPVKPSGS